MSETDLKKQRTAIKSTLTRIKTYVSGFDPSTDEVSNLNARDKKLDDLWSEYNTVQTSLESINEDTYASDRELFEDAYFVAKSAIQKFMSSTPITSSESTSSPRSSTSVKLPDIQIPTFTGDYKHWNSFKDIFRSIIHDNKEISAVQKLYYLKGAVKSEAAKVIEAIAPTPENYEVAWDLLNERYDNKEFIVNSHLKALFELSPVTRGSSITMRNLLTTTKQNIRALEALGLPTTEWDIIIIYLLSSKLDINTKQAWQLHKQSSELPTLSQFLSFLEQKCTAMEIFNTSEKSTTIQSKSTLHATSTSSIQKVHTTICKLCKKDHYLTQCSEFLNKSSSERSETTRQLGICYNCLKSGHSAKHCKSSSCRKCHKRHHTLLHLENKASTEESGGNQIQVSNKTTEVNREYVTHSHVQHRIDSCQVLLSTAIVNVRDSEGRWHDCRVLLDGASQSNIVTSTFAAKLAIRHKRTTVAVSGINQIPTTVNKVINLTIASKSSNFTQSLEFLILEKITKKLPVAYVPLEKINIPENIILADPNFNEPQDIDMLLGAEIYYEILTMGKVSLGVGKPILLSTKFGWTIAGKMPMDANGALETHSYLCHSQVFTHEHGLEEKLSNFWEIENVYKEKRSYTKEERLCEEKFKETTKRDDSGRYVVNLPLKEATANLGDSYTEAKRRFLSLEKRLQNNTELRNSYTEFIHEYINLGHMESASDPNDNNQEYYIPHHCVIKPTSTTTKLRVVFDASMKTSNGKSLNDNLLIGPNLYEELFSIIVRFRMHKIAFSTDIKKMFRQILVSEEHRDLQRILWRDNPSEMIQIFRLKTVTYGLSSSPYLATRTVKALAETEAVKYPLASKLVQEDLYVDDLLSGAENIYEALEMQKQLRDLFKAGGFELHKWSSNDPTFLSQLHQLERETKEVVDLKDNQVQTLGILWIPQKDQFKFQVNIFEPEQETYTKRKILAEIASIFDPLGVFGPVILKAKLFMKSMWAAKVDWDEKIDEEFESSWRMFRNQLHQLIDITIDRYMIGIPNPIKLQLVGFSDASEVAYGACLYLRAEDGLTNVSIRLICSKSRVAPMKPLSLPRLELCGALILSQLTCKVKENMRYESLDTYLWTDSTIVLSWINSSSQRWKTFVANRITEIQELTENCKWNHVNSADNPADYLSRGVNPEDLNELHMWWCGPEWLSSSSWPEQTAICNEDTTELKASTTNILTCVEQWSIFTRYSSFIKLQRVVAYCKRFIHNCKYPNLRLSGCITTTELHQATKTLIILVQHESFPQELKDIKTSKTINPKSKLVTLTPFLDEDNILRVGGRIKYSLLPYNQKHQIILPSKHSFTKLLIEYEHKRLLHAGTQALLTNLRLKYWIIGGRNSVRSVIHKCITCFKFKMNNLNQLMGDLPDIRVQPIRPFYKTGIDYGGPFYVRRNKSHKTSHDKIYIALFICMATKAIHLETVTSLSSEDFISALKRFISRRGRCHTIFSDNATTFKGANHELNELHQFFKNQENTSNIIDYAATEGMEWKFIPPRSPNFGGLWEAGIRSVKYHIKRVIGESKLLMEDFNTLLIQIEGCVNSRPILPIHDDPTDLSILTPGHFLIGEPLTQIPEPSLTEIKINRLTRFQLIQTKLQHFWNRWSQEYLTCLQQRYKWNRSSPNIHVGDLVLIKEDSMRPSIWTRARVIDVHPGRDGVVRVATVRTATGTFKRSIRNLCLLPYPKDQQLQVESELSREAVCSEQEKSGNPTSRASTTADGRSPGQSGVRETRRLPTNFLEATEYSGTHASRYASTLL